MCGIFGYLGNVDKQLALHCTHLMTHRGPDDFGIWCREDITLGHRRLSILDVSNLGRQPMTDETKRYQVVYNGEIYNFLEIKDELTAAGYTFHTETDTEVVLKSFIHWGADCFLKFNGMWSLLIWDDALKKLFLCRDRFGKKPLFYVKLANGDFAFASEMKALLPLLPVVEINHEILGRGDFHFFQYESTEQCLIKGIKRFPAGHYGWTREGDIEIIKWWNTLDHLPDIADSHEERVEQLRSLFLDACRLRMRSDVPIGTALSGGLDSSAVITCMSHIAQQKTGYSRIGDDWQHAFVASFAGTPLDETVYARMVTDHININPLIIQVDPEKVIDRLYHYLYLFEELYLTSPIPFMMTYSSVKKHGVSVTLDGHGADELFGGYSFDFLYALLDALKEKDFLAIDNIYNMYCDSVPDDATQFTRPKNKKLFLAKWYLFQGSRLVLKRDSRFKEKYGKDARWKKFDHLTKRLFSATHDTILPTLLRNYDRYSMANGVEIRMPFMDHRIVSFAFALPWWEKVRVGYSKSIVRDAVAPFMPQEIAYRKTKIGFNSPMTNWLKGSLRDYFLDIIHSKSFDESELIDSPKVKSNIKEIINSDNATFSAGERVWSMITPYLWHEAFVKGKGAR